jgi:hypothetical protein
MGGLLHWFHQWYPSCKVVYEYVNNPAPALPKLGERTWTAHISRNDGVVENWVNNPALPSPNLGRETG